MKTVSLDKTFGEKPVFSSLSVEIRKGETTLLLGPSGSGKTTLLRLLSGLDENYSGTIEDKPVKPVVLFQEDRLVPSMSVMNNLKAVERDEERILSVLSSLGLEGEERKKVSELSGGMKRRVAIARMLLVDGDFYGLDEPFTGLDMDTRMKVAGTIRKALAGKTVVVVTHDEADGELLGASGRIYVGGKNGK